MVVAVVDNMNVYAQGYTPVSALYPEAVYIPGLSSVIRVLNALLSAFGDRDGFEIGVMCLAEMIVRT